MERREFIQGIATALSAAVLPAITGCRTVRGPTLQSLTGLTPTGRSNWLRERARAIREAASKSDLSNYARTRGASPGLVGNVAAAVWITSTFRDLPLKMRRLPEIQQWMLDEGPAIAEAAFGVTDLLESIPPEERESLDELVRDDETLVEAFSAGLDVKRAESGVEEIRTEQARGVLRQAEWRMRHQSTSAVIDDYVDRVDRTCRRHGFARSEWRERLEVERPAWAALTVLSDPDNPVVTEVAASMSPDWVEPLGHSGGHLGVWVKSNRHRKGAEVLHVMPNSPAEEAGIMPGDRIMAVEGKPVSSMEMVSALWSRKTKDPVSLSVRRGRDHLQVSSRLEPGPGDKILRARNERSREYKNQTVASGYAIFGVGIRIVLGAAIVFVIGLLLLLAGGLDTTAGSIGAVMTVGGVAVCLLGLFLIALGGIVILVGNNKDDPVGASPPPEPLREDEREGF